MICTDEFSKNVNQIVCFLLQHIALKFFQTNKETKIIGLYTV